MNKTLTAIQKITFCAMLIALDVLATRFLRTPIIPNLPFLRISFGPAIVIYSSLFLGPYFGAVVGGAGDLIGILIFTGIEGQINPLVTIVYTLLGIAPYFLLKLTTKFKKSLQKPYFILVFMVLIIIIQCLLFYVIPTSKEYFNNGFKDYSYWIEPLIICLTFFFNLLSFIALYFMNKRFKNKANEINDFPSPYQLSFVCLIVEIVLMTTLLSLAFYIFYNFLASDAFPIQYGILFSCTIVFSGFKVIVNTFTSYLLLFITKKYLIK